MVSGVSIVTGLLLCHAALTGLCLAMDRHHAQALGRRPGAPLSGTLRAAGWGLLGLALWYCGRSWGWAIGPVAWFGLLSVAALILVFSLPYAPRAQARLALFSLTGAVVLMLS